ncbi:MAG: hypothetical protein ABIK09_04570 [Pseudomonadota bacterium]
MTATVLVAVTLVPDGARAAEHPQDGFSMGFVLGDPSGLTLRGGIGERMAIQAHFGFSPFPGDAVAVMVDWTYDAWDLLKGNSTASLYLFFGIGAKGQWFTGRYYAYHDKHYDHYLADQSHFGLGVRGLLGLRASFRKAPIDIFFELAPIGIIFVVPDAGVYYDIDAALGLRYRF